MAPFQRALPNSEPTNDYCHPINSATPMNILTNSLQSDQMTVSDCIVTLRWRNFLEQHAAEFLVLSFNRVVLPLEPIWQGCVEGRSSEEGKAGNPYLSGFTFTAQSAPKSKRQPAVTAITCVMEFYLTLQSSSFQSRGLTNTTHPPSFSNSAVKANLQY